ncbi:DnaJ-like protein [Leucoagaricus gongylophorus]
MSSPQDLSQPTATTRNAFADPMLFILIPSSPSTTAVAQSKSVFISDGAKPAKKVRQIGTQDRPLETGYYELLNVPITATTDNIKRAYRHLAIKHHPDKSPDDPEAEDCFKQIAITYQTLSDPALRKKYKPCPLHLILLQATQTQLGFAGRLYMRGAHVRSDMHQHQRGLEELLEFQIRHSAQLPPIPSHQIPSLTQGGYVDPEELFGVIFAREMKAALQEAEDAERQSRSKDAKGREIMSPEEKGKRKEKEHQKAAEKVAGRAKRVEQPVENLTQKLGIFTEPATGPEDTDVSRSWIEAEYGS